MKTNLYAVLVFFSCFFAKAQNQDNHVNFPSPNAASLGVYGEVPVSYFTGVPNISIPIYTVSEGDLSVPISLSYHISSVKPESHPGWVGLGWSLSAGGSITREVKGLPDEWRSDPTISHWSDYKPGYYYHKDYFDNSLWHTDASLNNANAYREYAFADHNKFEVIPDIFRFNFFGYSGSFYYNHKGKWVVKSDQNVKIVFDEMNGGIIDKQSIREPIRSQLGTVQNTTVPNDSNIINSFFNEFTIITEDGTEYLFGGVNATEYSISYRKQQSSIPIATTWNLKKITSSTNQVIEFKYTPGNLVCTFSKVLSFTKRFIESGPSFLDTPCNNTAFPRIEYPYPGHLIFPTYLESIETSNIKLEFERSNTTELRYPISLLTLDVPLPPVGYNYQNHYVYFGNDETLYNLLNGNDDPARYDELQWSQLDKIKILDKGTSMMKRSFSFDYTNSLDTRLKLKSLSTTDIGVIAQEYKFMYNSNSMPDYLSDKIDHWGFYNGNTQILSLSNTASDSEIDNVLSNFSKTKDPDATGAYLKYETLEKIIYPTGGFTTFEFEPHAYSKAVPREREKALLQYDKDQVAGGLRIKKINLYSKEGKIEKAKEFLYFKNYEKGIAHENLHSSGILNGIPKYYWENYKGTAINNQYYNYTTFSSNSLLPALFGDHGSHLGYSEVVEMEDGAGYKKYTYTNYDTDIHGNTHQDEAAVNYLEFERSVYAPHNSKSIERGKMTSLTDFNEKNTKVKESILHYQKSTVAGEDFLRSFRTEYLKLCGDKAAIFGEAFKVYTYDYNLVKKEDYIYDINGENPIYNKSEYDFNTENLISEKRDFVGTDTYTTKFYYPFDYPSNTGMTNSMFDKMIDRHIIAPVIKQEVLKNSNLISTAITTYKEWDLDSDNVLETILPKYIKSSKSNNSLRIDVDFKNYGIAGNLTRLSKLDDTETYFIWGYNHQFPIVKIENFPFSNIAALNPLIENIVSKSNLDVDRTIDILNSNGSISYVGTEGELRQKNNDLRNSSLLGNSLITSYTYDPVFGVTSKTDSRGYTVYYKYDELGRLIELIDAKGNIVNKTEYNYKQN